MKRIDITEILVCKIWIVLCFIDGSNTIYDTSEIPNNEPYHIEFNDNEFLIVQRNGSNVHKFNMMDPITESTLYSRLKNYSYCSRSSDGSETTIYTGDATNYNAIEIDGLAQTILYTHNISPNRYLLIDHVNDYWLKIDEN